VELEYKPGPRLRVLEEQFPISEYPIQGAKASGVQLSKKEVKSIRMA
jgi:topoisomerase-4 subunit A